MYRERALVQEQFSCEGGCPVAPIRSRGCHWGMVERRPLEVVRDVMALTFWGSRTELERLTALRLQAAFVLIFLAGRGVHLGQAGVDLALAGGAYTHDGLALGLMVACVAESACCSQL